MIEALREDSKKTVRRSTDWPTSSPTADWLLLQFSTKWRISVIYKEDSEQNLRLAKVRRVQKYKVRRKTDWSSTILGYKVISLRVVSCTGESNGFRLPRWCSFVGCLKTRVWRRRPLMTEIKHMDQKLSFVTNVCLVGTNSFSFSLNLQF